MRVSDFVRAFEVGTAVRHRRHGPAYVRAINYHAIPRGFSVGFEAQLRFFRAHFVPAGPAELEALLAGRWSHERPGVILSFDDGGRSHYEVVAPLLEQYGFTGWFFVPARLLAGEERAPRAAAGLPREPRMSPAQIRQLAETHVVGCHSFSHSRLRASLGDERLRREIVESKQVMELALERPVESFCWVGGDEPSYSAAAAALIREAGYRYAFMTNLAPILPTTHPHQLQRTNVEAYWPLARVRFYLSGVMDLVYGGKRRRVNELTRDTSSRA